ncbi:MAG: hypothetical protein J0L73_10430 [Verrucomicrobia bacterium]|nr:hypothetical protein [Verrucomicrobiota bacterium]
MSSPTDEADAIPRASTRALLWKSFLTVSVVLPWGMIACLSIFMSGLAMGTGNTSDDALIRALAPVAPGILLWFAYSLGVSICTERRHLGIILGLALGWLYLSLWLLEKMPALLPQLLSPQDDMQLTKSVLTLYITGAGWLTSLSYLLSRLRSMRASLAKE